MLAQKCRIRFSEFWPKLTFLLQQQIKFVLVCRQNLSGLVMISVQETNEFIFQIADVVVHLKGNVFSSLIVILFFIRFKYLREENKISVHKQSHTGMKPTRMFPGSDFYVKPRNCIADFKKLTGMYVVTKSLFLNEFCQHIKTSFICCSSGKLEFGPK